MPIPLGIGSFAIRALSRHAGGVRAARRTDRAEVHR
jgi:hypothetical protein